MKKPWVPKGDLRNLEADHTPYCYYIKQPIVIASKLKNYNLYKPADSYAFVIYINKIISNAKRLMNYMK